LNLRLDGHRELYDAVKAAAAERNTSVNQFVINTLRAAVGWEVEKHPHHRISGY
jgi:predicted HicB family RNase H-like nuclease